MFCRQSAPKGCYSMRVGISCSSSFTLLSSTRFTITPTWMAMSSSLFKSILVSCERWYDQYLPHKTRMCAAWPGFWWKLQSSEFWYSVSLVSLLLLATYSRRGINWKQSFWVTYLDSALYSSSISDSSGIACGMVRVVLNSNLCGGSAAPSMSSPAETSCIVCLLVRWHSVMQVSLTWFPFITNIPLIGVLSMGHLIRFAGLMTVGTVSRYNRKKNTATLPILICSDSSRFCLLFFLLKGWKLALQEFWGRWVNNCRSYALRTSRYINWDRMRGFQRYRYSIWWIKAGNAILSDDSLL